MVDKNLLLYLPFDDPDGSVACDYTAHRQDAELTGGAGFTKDAFKGKALALNGGEGITTQSIPFDSDFTVCAYVKVATNCLGWLLNLPGLDNYHEQWLDVKPGRWYFIAFVLKGNIFDVYLDNDCVFTIILDDTPIGLSINSNELLTTTASIDELKIFNMAKTANEILKMQADTSDVEYYIDGVNFKEYGVYVSASDGLVGRLAQKDALSVDFDNYHGVMRDRRHKRYKEREISLQCFIEAASRNSFVEKQFEFLSLFDGDGTHRLTVEYDGKTKPLVYEVELLDETKVSKKWGGNCNDTMVSTFTLKLTESEPVKRVLRHISDSENSEVEITVTTSKFLNVYWGDGTHTFNIGGNQTSIRHTYKLPGEYDIIITGVIEDIEKFETNAIVIWELLK